MPVKINNLESNINVIGDGSYGSISEEERENIIKIVMDRIREEQEQQERINAETKITNRSSKKDLFD